MAKKKKSLSEESKNRHTEMDHFLDSVCLPIDNISVSGNAKSIDKQEINNFMSDMLNDIITEFENDAKNKEQQ